MNVLIIEDEKPAAAKLSMLIQSILPEVTIVAILQSIKQSVNWLKENSNAYDLLFLDIQLADGKSFEIFKQVRIDKPIIFTTAYNEYAVEAFKVNSIDYLLKPVTKERLQESLNKLDILRKNLPTAENTSQMVALQKVLANLQKQYKNRFMVKVGEHIKSVTSDKIAYFFAEGRTLFLFTLKGRKFIIDYTLEELESLLEPDMFFRVNRSFTINIHAITDVVVFSNSRLKIITEFAPPKEIIVSREKVPAFKDWFDGAEIG
jgi:DNA-binding LytR/AlgR family response regulator